MLFAATANAQPRPGGGGHSPSGGGGSSAGGLIIKIQADQVAQLLNDAGFPSKVIETKNGDHMVVSAFWNDQIFSGAIPEACEKDGSGCHAVMLFANLGKDTGVDEAWLDAWNKSYWYTHVFKLDSGELVFYWHVGLLTGVTPDYIKLAAKLFKANVDASTDFKP
jgi:hypothetical protein